MKTTVLHIEIFANQHLGCGEGPVWDYRNNHLYWTDSGSEKIFFATKNNAAVLVSNNFHAASLALHEKGGLVIGNRDGFFHLQHGQLRPLATGNELKDINDIIADPLGRIFGGQESFRDNGEYTTGHLFRIDSNGITIVDDGIHLGNGMGFDPKLDRFYFVDTIARRIYKYDYSISTGQVSNKKIFVQFQQDEGLPDGLTVDAEGFIWVARWFGAGISRYDPDGKLERTIVLPFTQPTSLTFGGANLDEIFVTSAAINWQTPLAPRDHDYLKPRGGSVYRIQQDIQGRQEFLVNI